MSLLDAVKQVADVIANETGLHTVADPRQVVLPCVMVGPPDIDFENAPMGGYGGQVEVPVNLLAAGAWNLDALAQLSDMLDKVLAVEGMVGPASAKPGQVDLPDGGQVPTYRLVYRMAVQL